MENGNVVIAVRPNGVQTSKFDAVPTPFSFERNVLAGGAYNSASARAILQLFILDMFPKNNEDVLFTWESLTPHVAITIAATYHTLNASINKNSVSSGTPFKMINDADISKKVERTGIMSPNQVEIRYSPSGLSIA
jgi:hypothetical protein